MTDAFFVGEPLPLCQGFGFGEMFLPGKDGVGEGGGELGEGAERGTGEGEGEEALEEGLGGPSGSVEEVGLEVGATVSSGTVMSQVR